jgi:heat shock protein HslJ
MKKILLSGLLVLIVSGCKNTPEVINTELDISNAIDNKSFIVKSINTKEISYHKNINISFKKNIKNNVSFVYLKLHCNNVFANYKYRDDYISFNDIKLTSKKCTKKDSLVSKEIREMLNNSLKLNINEKNIILSDLKGNEIVIKGYKKIKK